MKQEEYHWESQIREWLKEICPWDRVENYVQFHGRLPLGCEFDKGKYRLVQSEWADQGSQTWKSNHQPALKMLVFTKDNYYAIVASESYLGCTMSVRKPRAGEDWTRGNDLPDGKFCRKTWEKIKDAIIRQEMVRVAFR